SLLRRELVVCYRAYCRGEAPELPAARPYGEYIGWLQRQDLAAAESFWRRELAGFAAPTPLGPGRPPGAGRERPGAAGSRPFALTPPASAALHAFARRHSLTAGLLLAAGWGVLLARYSGEQDVVFGITVSGRPAELAGALSMVGPFINSLPLRVQTPWRRRVLPWLTAMRASYLELLRHEYSPLVEIQGWSEVPRGLPLFESLLVYQNFPRAAGTGDGDGRGGEAPLRFTDLQSSGRASFPLAVCLSDRAAGLGGAFDYDAERLDGLLVGGMARHLATVLEALVEDPERELVDLALLSPAERHQLLVEWNDTGGARAAGATVAGLWEAQVVRTPEALAVRWGERRLTYRELNRRANQLAHHLRARGVGPEVRVAVAVERSPELIVALLAVLKAGGAHVTLDPAHPPQRLAYVLADSAAAVVVTEERLLAGLGPLPAGAPAAVCLDRDREAIAGRPEENPQPLADPGNLAYVFYTSGSTGRPKAVAIAHRSCAAFLEALGEVFDGEELAGVLATTSAVFDCAVFELYLPLVRGGAVVLAGSALDLVALDRAAAVTLVNVGPSALAELLAASPLPVAVRTVHVSGEAPSAQLVAELYRRGVARVWNGYGPTEGTTLSTLCRLGRDEAGAPPIGRPIAGGAHVT
ncbi:MAG TPA: AMP-binding protein, partial [Thermoanaerobaculia bacterium]